MKINKLLFTTTLTALALTACSPKGTNSDSEIENKVEALLDCDIFLNLLFFVFTHKFFNFFDFHLVLLSHLVKLILEFFF